MTDESGNSTPESEMPVGPWWAFFAGEVTCLFFWAWIFVFEFNFVEMWESLGAGQLFVVWLLLWITTTERHRSSDSPAESFGRGIFGGLRVVLLVAYIAWMDWPPFSSLTNENPDTGQSWPSWLWDIFLAVIYYGVWAVIWGLVAIGILVALGIVAKVFGWSSEKADEGNRPLRALWVDQTIQLLIMAAVASREDLTLRDRERSLIKNIALSEAKRTDAPGEPNPLPPADVEAIIRGYESGVPGIGELLESLTDAKYAPMRTRLLKRVWQIIVHDGPASEAEVNLAEQFASETGMTEAEYLAVSRRFHHPAPPRESLAEAQSLLDVSASVTAEDVKRAYRRKARDYHPDKLAGSAEHFKQLAAEHLKKLRNARDLLIESVDNSRLVAKGVGGRLVPASDLPEKVQCFSCAAIRPGTSPNEAKTARCPRCFTLLYHEPDFAAELNRGPAASSPVGC